MKGSRLAHLTPRRYATLLFFGIAVATLVVLGIRVFGLLNQQVRTIHEEFVESRQAQAELTALHLGLSLQPPTLGRLGDFEVAPMKALGTGTHVVALAPNWPAYGLRVSAEAEREAADRLERRLMMVTGEGTLLISLILVCLVMLAHLVRAERRARLEMETFFRTVSHELKTPVAGVRALLETLVQRPVPPEDLARYARLGLRETTHLQTLIENVLLANRLDRSRLGATPKPIKLAAELRRYLDTRARLFPAQTLDVELDDDGGRAYADPELLRVVLDNLLDNAFKYSPAGAPVRLGLRREGEWCILSVSDRGIGFAPNEAASLFRKFFRARAARAGGAKGSGLGLYIAHEIVASFGGRLTAQSEGEGKGSTFRLHLRRMETDAHDGT